MPKYYNGHPVLTEMPAPRLFMTKNEEAVRVSLKYPKSPIGSVDIYVHKKCLTYRGGKNVNAVYDVLLVDNDYKLYYPVKNDQTGMFEIQPSEKSYSTEEICKLAEITKNDYKSHPVESPKQTFMEKLKGVPQLPPSGPRDMIDPENLEY